MRQQSSNSQTNHHAESNTSQNGTKTIKTSQNKQTALRPIQTKQGQKSPIQARQRPVKAKQTPVQRQAQKPSPKISEDQPKGSVAFQQIASQMGAQHGVNTSVLQAKHNSDFPATVDADATIQGNQVDFAPGKDTSQNMRHEVAHYIVNSQRGTPPTADKTVNGQKVNTTDEQKADQLAGMPLQRMETPDTARERDHQALTNHTGFPVQRTIMNGQYPLISKSAAQMRIEKLFKQKQEREPNSSEQAKINQLITQYIGKTKETKTVDEIVEEVINEASRKPKRNTRSKTGRRAGPKPSRPERKSPSSKKDNLPQRPSRRKPLSPVEKDKPKASSSLRKSGTLEKDKPKLSSSPRKTGFSQKGMVKPGVSHEKLPFSSREQLTLNEELRAQPTVGDGSCAVHAVFGTLEHEDPAHVGNYFDPDYDERRQRLATAFGTEGETLVQQNAHALLQISFRNFIEGEMSATISALRARQKAHDKFKASRNRKKRQTKQRGTGKSVGKSATTSRSRQMEASKRQSKPKNKKPVEKPSVKSSSLKIEAQLKKTPPKEEKSKTKEPVKKPVIALDEQKEKNSNKGKERAKDKPKEKAEKHQLVKKEANVIHQELMERLETALLTVNPTGLPTFRVLPQALANEEVQTIYQELLQNQRYWLNPEELEALATLEGVSVRLYEAGFGGLQITNLNPGQNDMVHVYSSGSHYERAHQATDEDIAEVELRHEQREKQRAEGKSKKSTLPKEEAAWLSWIQAMYGEAQRIYHSPFKSQKNALPTSKTNRARRVHGLSHILRTVAYTIAVAQRQKRIPLKEKEIIALALATLFHDAANEKEDQKVGGEERQATLFRQIARTREGWKTMGAANQRIVSFAIETLRAKGSSAKPDTKIGLGATIVGGADSYDYMRDAGPRTYNSEYNKLFTNKVIDGKSDKEFAKLAHALIRDTDGYIRRTSDKKGGQGYKLLSNEFEHRGVKAILDPTSGVYQAFVRFARGAGIDVKQFLAVFRKFHSLYLGKYSQGKAPDFKKAAPGKEAKSGKAPDFGKAACMVHGMSVGFLGTVLENTYLESAYHRLGEEGKYSRSQDRAGGGALGVYLRTVGTKHVGWLAKGMGVGSNSKTKVQLVLSPNVLRNIPSKNWRASTTDNMGKAPGFRPSGRFTWKGLPQRSWGAQSEQGRNDQFNRVVNAERPIENNEQLVWEQISLTGGNLLAIVCTSRATFKVVSALPSFDKTTQTVAVGSARVRVILTEPDESLLKAIKEEDSSE